MNNKKCKYCGAYKNTYQDKWMAIEQQAYALEKRKITLEIYPCPKSKSWHLTSKNKINFY